MVELAMLELTLSELEFKPTFELILVEFAPKFELVFEPQSTLPFVYSNPSTSNLDQSHHVLLEYATYSTSKSEIIEEFKFKLELLEYDHVSLVLSPPVYFQY